MELVFGQWKYFNDTKSLTKATYSLDIPMKAIKILSFKNDIIMDPFSGSGTTFLANEIGEIVSIITKPNTKEHSKEIIELFNN